MVNRRDINGIFNASCTLLVERSFISVERAAMLVCEFQHCVIEEVEEHFNSACVIPCPFVDADNLRFSPIKIRIGKHENPILQRYIIYHELAHFLSIDKLIQLSQDCFVRYWGICRTKYVIEHQQVNAFQSCNELYQINEKLNDCLACYLFRCIEGMEPPSRFLLKRGSFAHGNQEKVIRMYLQHEVDTINGCCTCNSQ